mmetsp:Transcript_45698/g.67468  ORF Transcript_45698/g.67468 Transcript_45698/m.67468 type:complete len:1196 (-) Transcript_45698:285-3872(-)|eukprot:CAMPEP_0195523176 /NCGR_PEP_ID=MMETSP0794_2-20130614/22058_1 /TAXON_ID=515487 /ORGANISM="Stephanopyxis turris, Strain CCMP 815" /LENGTH=1195 /DNA_ID=CAMNT_0040653097 /DNA_START=45 /DNA_END=3632 /DNA_ORIENTATION=+
MKLSKLFVSTLAFSLPHVFSENPCVTGAFTFSFDGECNYESARKAYLDVFNDYMNRSSDCSRTAEEDFLLLLNAVDSSEGEDKVHAICGEAFDNAIEIPFKNIAMQTRDYEFERRFFNGDTRWNEETETPGGTSVLRTDATNVRQFFHNFAKNVHVEWPDELSNFKKCTTNAAMCCWPRDRQANDKEGTCRKPYDSECYDKNPLVNTNLCFMDLAKGDTSTDFGSLGTVVFQNDEDEPIHCDGFAWGNDPNDFTNRYKANNLFFISMYHNMLERGYVENIPGAPMCACVEQMPVVTRSGCKQIDVDENFKFTYDGTSFTAELTDINIVFQDCEGLNNSRDDLRAYMGKLYREGKVTSDQYAALGNVLVGPSNCPYALDYHYATKGYVPAHNQDPTVWTQVAGKGVFDFAFEEKGRLQTDALFKASENKIILRICRRCIQSHKHIYYRHLKDISADRFIVDYLKNGVNRVTNNEYSVDFLLFSSYQDALAQTNEWECNYDVHKPFPGECAPSGSAQHQHAGFFPSHGQPDVAFFVEKSTTTEMTKLENSLDIGDASGRPGSAVQDGDTIYMTGSGTRIWQKEDNCHYLYEQKTGDVDMVVKVNKFDYAHPWSKAGLMIREDLEANSKQLILVDTSYFGPRLQARPVKGLDMWSKGGDSQGAPIWLKLTKRGSLFIAYTSENGEDWMAFKSCVLDFDANFYVGLVVGAENKDGLAEAEFFQYNTESFYYPSASPSVSIRPSMSISVQDIGGGTSSAVSNGDSWSMTSKSGDVWGNSDSFGFLQETVTNGDVSVVVHVRNFEESAYWSKTGIMIRESLDANSKHVSAILVVGEGPVINWRQETGLQTQNHNPHWVRNVKHQWLKLIKRGDSFYAYAGIEKSDYEEGFKWELMGNSINVNMSSGKNLHVGMFLSSQNFHSASADFTDYLVSQTASPTAVPTTSAAPTRLLVRKVIVCGRRNQCAAGNEKVVSAETKHAVRCCSDSNIQGWRQNDGCNVWAASVCVKETFSLAVEKCKEIGGRICTKDELQAECTGYTGCSYDFQLNWSSDTVSHSKVLVKYYSGSWTRLPNFERMQRPFFSEYVKNIDFRDGRPMGAGKMDYFAALYEGRLKFPQPGTWTLCTTSDDGSALYINGEQTVSNDGMHAMEKRCGTFDAADEEIVRVRAEFFESRGGQGMIVSWQSPGGTLVPIPEDAWVGQ